MILLCNVCKPNGSSWVYGDKGVLAIAKWYPADRDWETLHNKIIL